MPFRTRFKFGDMCSTCGAIESRRFDAQSGGQVDYPPVDLSVLGHSQCSWMLIKGVNYTF
jgi:hypothetical protein